MFWYISIKKTKGKLSERLPGASQPAMQCTKTLAEEAGCWMLQVQVGKVGRTRLNTGLVSRVGFLISMMNW